MSFLHGHQYSPDFVFSQDVLLTLTPDDISRWMWWRLTGLPDANSWEVVKKVEAKEMKLLLWSNTLLCLKKVFLSSCQIMVLGI